MRCARDRASRRRDSSLKGLRHAQSFDPKKGTYTKTSPVYYLTYSYNAQKRPRRSFGAHGPRGPSSLYNGLLKRRSNPGHYIDNKCTCARPEALCTYRSGTPEKFHAAWRTAAWAAPAAAGSAALPPVGSAVPDDRRRRALRERALENGVALQRLCAPQKDAWCAIVTVDVPAL